MDINAKIRARRARRFAQNRNTNNAEKRSVRSTYNQAIRDGLSHDEALALANGVVNVRQEKDETRPETRSQNAPAVEIPADWETMHWRKRLSLAEQISGTKIQVDSDANAKASQIIADAVAAGASGSAD